MGRFDRSMQLFSASWRVLREDKGLAVFPFVSSVATLAIAASFALPIWTVRVQHLDGSVAMSPPGWALAALGYFVLTYVTIFCNAALVLAANERLTGQGPGTVASGFAGAASRAGAIAPWALLTATVTLVLRMLEQRAGLLGRVVIGIVGIAWSLVTYLVVPVLVLEGTTTGVAISRSSHLFKRTWGENMIGNVGLGMFSFLGLAMSAAVVMVGVMSSSPVVLAVCIVVAVIWFVVVAEVVAALGGIYRVALYRFAADGTPPTAFGSFDFAGAFRPKKRGVFGSGSSTGTGFAYDPRRFSADAQTARPGEATQTWGVGQPGFAPQAPPDATPWQDPSPWDRPGEPPSPRGF